jgi:glycosyltransferase involved in cell wall biosynthesis
VSRADRERVRNALVSVIIPTWNRPELLRTRSIPSVLAQTHAKLELIVVFDGSDEDVQDASMEGVTDPRVRWMWIPRPQYPPGLDGWHIAGSYAVNRGLDLASGTFTCVLGDDDEYLPTYLERCLDVLARDGSDVAYSASEVVGLGYLGVVYPPRFAQQIGGEFLWRRSDIRLDPECWRKGLPNDWDLVSRLMAGKKVSQVRAALYKAYPSWNRPACYPSLPW